MQVIKDLEARMEQHPCCYDWHWQENSVKIIFPPGYCYQQGAGGVLVNMGPRTRTLIRALEILEHVWESSLPRYLA